MKTFLSAKTGSIKFARIAIAALMTSALIPLHSAFAQTVNETVDVMPGHNISTAQEREISREAAKDAAAKSNQKLQKSIAASKADITRLKANIGDKSAAAKAHYDKVIADLHQAIRDL